MYCEDYDKNWFGNVGKLSYAIFHDCEYANCM